MKRLLAIPSVIGFAVLAAVLSVATPAFAAADASAADTVNSGALTLRDTLVSIATTVLPYAAAILAIVVGWRLARRFVRA